VTISLAEARARRAAARDAAGDVYAFLVPACDAAVEAGLSWAELCALLLREFHRAQRRARR
jgi:hypothetical protein